MIKLGVLSVKTIICQLKWFVLIIKWRLLVEVLICFKCVRHITQDCCEINYSINNCHMNNKSHDFYFHKLLILRGLWTWLWNVGCFDILEIRSKSNG